MATSSPTETGLALAFLIAAAAFGAAAAAAAAGEKTKTAAVSATGQEPMVKLEIPLFKSKKCSWDLGISWDLQHRQQLDRLRRLREEEDRMYLEGLVYVYYREMSLCDNPDDLFWLRKSMEGIQDVLDKWDWRGKEGEDDEEEDPVPWVQEGAAADGEKE